MDPEIFERLNRDRLACGQALETHWTILLERRRGAVTAEDELDPDWPAEHERLVRQAAAADAALVAALQWSGPPAGGSR